MSSQLEQKVDVELPAGPVAATRRPLVRWGMLAVGLLLTLALPWFVYPPVAMDIAAWALFAISVDLLLGYTGLLSFGHAAFWGTSAYTSGLIASNVGVPFPVAILGGAVAAMVLAVPIGYLSVKRTGIYFAMVTLAFWPKPMPVTFTGISTGALLSILVGVPRSTVSLRPLGSIGT
jgi:branched-chain amino acid transport system permease protein